MENFSLGSFDINAVLEYLSIYGLKVIGSILIFMVGRWVGKMLIRLLRSMMNKSEVDATLSGFLLSILNAMILAVVVIFALSNLGIDTTSLAAVIAAAGLAIGLSLQDSLSNLASGVMIIMFKPFSADQYAEVGGVAGIVEEIGIFNTKMRTPDNKTVIVPNGQITTSHIINYTARETRRMDLVMGVSYDDDVVKVREVLMDILKNDEGVLEDPAPQVGILEFADSSINFAVRPWVKTAEYWDVYFRLNEQFKLRLDEENISIPYPQRDVHLYQQAAANENADNKKPADTKKTAKK